MTFAIIDYGGGNVHSVARALNAAGAQNCLLTRDPTEILQAERIVFPGQGAFGPCAEILTAELRAALTQAVQKNAVPFLGICVGLQILGDTGEEAPNMQGLGWLPGKNPHLKNRVDNTANKFPNMGWAAINVLQSHPVLNGLDGAYFYYANSYAFEPNEGEQVIATSDYGGAFTAIAAKDNIIGVQFHPEKSQAVGLRLLQLFLNWIP